ncbi:unnamed protein product [Sphagnum compactum]
MMALRGAGAGALLFRALFRHPTCSSTVVVSYNVLLPVEESVGLLLLPETSLHAPVLGGFSSCLGFRGFAAAAEVKKNNAAAAADVVPRPSMPRLSSNGILGRRFYKKAHVKPAEDRSSGWYVVLLDNRVLKTPAKKPLKVPNAALAHAIAAEWEWQDSSGIRPFTMPLMKLAATSIDQMPSDRDRVVESLLKYFHTDSLCLRAPDMDPLAEKQVKMWDPLLDWFKSEIGVRPLVTSSIFGTTQPPEVLDAVEKAVRQCSDWQLAAVDWLAGTARSLIVALAIARGRLGIEEAIEIIRLEEDHQACIYVEDWGYVEGGHDIDEADIRVKISSCSVFLRLL